MSGGLVAAGLIVDITQARPHGASLPFLIAALTIIGLWGRAKSITDHEPTSVSATRAPGPFARVNLEFLGVGPMAVSVHGDSDRLVFITLILAVVLRGRAKCFWRTCAH